MAYLTTTCVNCGKVIEFIEASGRVISVAHFGCKTPMAEMITNNPKFLGVVSSDSSSQKG
jgi:hypothetical protein